MQKPSDSNHWLFIKSSGLGLIFRIFPCLWITGVGFAGHRNGTETLLGLKAMQDIRKQLIVNFFPVDILKIYKTEDALKWSNLW